MPLPAIAGAAIQGGSQVAGGVIGALATGQQNKKNRKFAENMYNRQKADNIEFWNMQNDYNSPQAQMKRFQEAGLNPNLIYGQGNSGPAGAIQTPDVQTPQTRTPEWGGAIQAGGLSFINSIYDLEIKQAQIDNLKAQNNEIKERTLLMGSQRTNTDVLGKRNQFDLDFESEFRPISADTRRERLRQLRTSTDLSINEDIRRAAINATSVQEAAERILTMQAQRNVIPYQKRQMTAQTAETYERIRQMQKDGRLKDLEIGLKDQGLTWQDPLWARKVAIALQTGKLPDDMLPGDVPLPDLEGTIKNFWNKLPRTKFDGKHMPNYGNKY